MVSKRTNTICQYDILKQTMSNIYIMYAKVLIQTYNYYKQLMKLKYLNSKYITYSTILKFEDKTNYKRL